MFTADDLVKTAYRAFDKSIGDNFGLGQANDLADEYLRGNANDPYKAADNLIHWQMAKTGAAGAVANIGGLVTMPVTIPANITWSFYHQMRMIGAIAVMSGIRDLHEDKVQTLCVCCLAGNSAKEILTGVGIDIGKRLAVNALKSLPSRVLTQINKAIGIQLFTKFGTTGVINIGKAIPLVGAVVGASVDAAFTYATGKAAKTVFLSCE